MNCTIQFTPVKAIPVIRLKESVRKTKLLFSYAFVKTKSTKRDQTNPIFQAEEKQAALTIGRDQEFCTPGDTLKSIREIVL